MTEAVRDGLRLFYSERFIAENGVWLLRRALQHMSLMPPPYALQRQARATMRYNGQGRLRHIKVPVLVLGATDDKIVPFPNQQELAKRIPQARFVPFEGAGHGFLTERATAVNRVVLDFLRENTSGFTPAK